MGGFADYSGSLVLETPVQERATVTVRRAAARSWRAVTRQADAAGGRPEAEVPLDGLRTRADFLGTAGGTWAAYVLGCAWMLHETHRLPLEGLEFEVDSSIPAGKGVASSAALEVAAMNALVRLYGLNLTAVQLPTLCQRVENELAGAPCGLMDQLTCHLGRAGKILPILCRPDRVGAPVNLPEGWRIAGVDSGVRHSVAGASYADVRAAAFMGYSMLAREFSATPEQLRHARESGNRAALPFKGYLAGMPPEIFAGVGEKMLPVSMTGREFMELGLPSIDRLTAIKPDTVYAVRACASHPVREHARCERMAALLASAKPDEVEAGALLAESHAGYAQCRLNEAVTDMIAKKIREKGPAAGLIGAKVSGGGGGGTVCVLYRGDEGEQSLRKIMEVLGRFTGKTHAIFTGSSDGAAYTP